MLNIYSLICITNSIYSYDYIHLTLNLETQMKWLFTYIKGIITYSVCNNQLYYLSIVYLNHWGRVTHICVSKINTIGSDNGLSPGRCQAIIWINPGILLMRTLGTNLNEVVSKIHTFSFKKMHLEFFVICERATIVSRPQFVKLSL